MTCPCLLHFLSGVVECQDKSISTNGTQHTVFESLETGCFELVRLLASYVAVYLGLFCLHSLFSLLRLSFDYFIGIIESADI